MAQPLCPLTREKQALENSMLLFIPLYCNFKEVSQIQKIKSRKPYAWRDTGERMKKNIGVARSWILKGKKNVGFAWRQIVR